MKGSRTGAQLLGQAGEDRALIFLQAQGLVPVERNFRCKAGEIDLILRQSEVLVFVEVRQRAPARFGGAVASITPAKQRRLLLASQYYLQRYASPPACRIDVIAIDGTELAWLKNAIEA